MSKTREIAAFELRYQLRQPAFWIATAAFVAWGVLVMTTVAGDLEGVDARVARNAPLAVVQHLSASSALGMFAVTVFVAGAALRDFSTRMHPLIFSRPIRPAQYLLGRFLGALAVALLSAALGALAMLATSLALGGSSPELGPTTLSPYLFGFAFLVVPNTLVVACLVFVLAAWTRKLGATFVGLLLFMIGQDVAEILPRAVFGDTLPGLLDPLGFAALAELRRYWTVADYAKPLAGIGGVLLGNRALWLLLAGGLFVLGLRTFDYARSASGRLFGRVDARARAPEPSSPLRAPSESPRPPTARPRRGWRVDLARTLDVARFELACLLRGPVIVSIGLLGLGLVIFAATRREALLDIDSQPVTRLMLDAVARGARVPVLVLVILISGQLVWREHSTRMSDTFDALPVRLWSIVTGKFLALVVALVGLQAAFGLALLAYQRALDFDGGEPGLLATGLGLALVPSLTLAALAVFLQVASNNRMLGYLCIGVFLAGRGLLGALGFTGTLLDYGGGPVPRYADMVGWGHRLAPFLWSQAYGSAIAGLLLVLAWLAWPNGLADGPRERLRLARSRLGPAAGACLGVLFLVALGTGAVLAWQNSGERGGLSRRGQRAADARYEATYRHLVAAEWPRVTAFQADVDLLPEERAVRIRGRYELVHEGVQPLRELFVNLDPEVRVLALAAPGAARTTSDVELGMYALEFEPALEPGARATLDFELSCAPTGFGLRASDRWMTSNGMLLLAGTGRHAFFRGCMLFPAFGYDATRELQEATERRRQGLGPWTGLPAPDSDLALAAWDQAPWADFDLTITTAPDQTVVAPGILAEQGESGGRRVFRYRSSRPMRAFFPIVSGRYELQRRSRGGVSLEVYYHAAHAWNVERMLTVTEATLEHLGAQLGPYPEESLRSAEIPGYGQFAASFPGVMFFSESMGFIERAPPEGEVDPLLWVVAHETAHQWWDGLVASANAQGSTFVSETLAQYGAMCVMDALAGPPMTRSASALFRESYLRGRGAGGREERPLLTVEDQDFVHYQKGWLALRAVDRALGRERVGRALREIVTRYGGPSGRPVTSLDVLTSLRDHAEGRDSAFLDDLFERIVFLEVAVESARASALDQGGYEVQLDLRAVKLVADGDGNEQPGELDDRLEVAVYGGATGDRLLESTVVHLTSASTPLVLRLDELPTRAVLDPDLLLIERDLTDNTIEIELED